MNPVKYVETRVKGVNTQVRAIDIDGRTVIVKGGWVKTAAVQDEELVEGIVVRDPDQFISVLKSAHLKADVFTFSQRPPDIAPRYKFPFDLDNIAAVPITSFDGWWEKRLPQETRKNVRRAAKRGVEIRVVSFGDELMRGVKKLCDELPVRQGRLFWHYGKDLETLKCEHSTYLERSEFIGAYFEGDLIGSIRMIYVDRTAILIHLLTLNAHNDKRPMNALLAKCVEVCAQKGMKYLVYGNFLYGNKKDSLMEFKRRNGFEQIDLPRYYVPLTLKGKFYVALRAYRGVHELVPAPVLSLLLSLRNWYYKILTSCSPV